MSSCALLVTNRLGVLKCETMALLIKRLIVSAVWSFVAQTMGHWVEKSIATMENL